jgi:ferrous iron transport protein A
LGCGERRARGNPDRYENENRFRLLASQAMTAATAPDFAPAGRTSARAAAPAQSAVSLASLAPGHTVQVVGVTGTGPESERLLDLGFVAGTSVEILKRAPLGDPVVYGLRGYRICLRASEAGLVRVRPE